MIARRLIVRGRVQGVGYRYAMVEAATRCGVPAGCAIGATARVEALVQGDADAVERLVAWCRRGPPRRASRAVEASIPWREIGSRASTRSACQDDGVSDRGRNATIRGRSGQSSSYGCRRQSGASDAEDVLPRGVARRGPQRQRQHQPEADRREPKPSSTSEAAP